MTATPEYLPGTLTISVAPDGSQLSVRLENEHKRIQALLSPEDARKVGADFFTAAATAELLASEVQS